MMRRVWAAMGLLAALSIPVCTTAQTGEDLPVHEIELENGMRILVLERPSVPTVSFVMQFGIGGVNEHLGTTGTAHLLEHMLFKGSETIGTTDVEAERRLFAAMDSIHEEALLARGAGDTDRVTDLENQIAALEDEARSYVIANEFDQILTRAGSRGLNAQTSSEATIYHVELPANRAELFFALEGDRMSNPVFREFYTERNVVLEERRMRVDTNPAGLLYEAHLDAAYSVHPYGVPVVGYQSDLEVLRREDVRDYYDRFYGPNNAVLAVVGAVDAEEIEGWARRYLGAIPAGLEPAPVLAREPAQAGERRIVVEWDARPQLRIGWHIPASGHEDAPALEMLGSILTGGRTSRLYRRLVVEERIATAVYSYSGPGVRYPQLFQIDAAPRFPATTTSIERAIYEEIDRLARDAPTEDELERVANQIEAGEIRGMQSNLGLAFRLAGSESHFGDWRETFRRSGRLGSVRPEDVQRVAGTYFRKSNRTVATLMRPLG